MSEAKDALIIALEASANALETVVGAEPVVNNLGDALGLAESLRDPNWTAKTKIRFAVGVMRSRARALKEGIYPLFGPNDASEGMELLERIRAEATVGSNDRAFQEAVGKAVESLRSVIERYGTSVDGAWKFRAEDADPDKPWEPPPAGS